MSSENPAVTRAINRDARIRGLRALMWGLFLDIAVAVTLVLLTAFTAIEWTTLYWQALGLTLAKSILQAIVTFAARKLLPPGVVTNKF